MRERTFVFVAALATLLATSSIAHATTITAANGGSLDVDNTVLSGGFPLASTNLLRTNLSSTAVTAGGASFDTSVAGLYDQFVNSSVWWATTDGFAPGNCGPNPPQNGYFQFTPTTIEFTLDTTGAKSLGYDLTGIVTLSGYPWNRNTVQQYDLNVWKVGASAWTPLYSVDSSLANNNSINPEVQVTASNFGAAGAGVAKIQMVFTTGTDYTTATQYHEMQVFGTAAPEPSSIVLLAAGLISLLAYAWQKRK